MLLIVFSSSRVLFSTLHEMGLKQSMRRSNFTVIILKTLEQNGRSHNPFRFRPSSSFPKCGTALGIM